MRNHAELLQQALNLHQTGQFDLAEQLYKDVLAADRRNVDANYLLGALFLHMGRVADAIAQLKAARKLKRNDPRITLDLGNASEAAGDLKAAEDCFRDTIAIAKDFPGGHFNLGNLLYKSDRYDEAAASFRSVLALEPNVLDAWVNLGNSLFGKEDIEEADKAYRHALSLNPDHPDLIVNVANVIFKQGKRAEAEAMYRQVLERDADNAVAHYNMGLLLEHKGDIAGALPHFERAVDKKPDLAEAWFHLGNLLQDDPERWDAASRCFSQSALVRQHDIDWNMGIGRALGAINEFAAAEICFQRVLKERPDDAEVQYWMARCLNGMERFEEAERYAREALRLRPDFHLTLLNLADSMFGAGQPENALPLIRQALEAMTDNPDAHARMGRYHMLRGEIEQSRSWYLRTLALRPDYPNASFDLGLCELLTGNFTAGWEAFAMMNRKALSLVNQSRELTSPTELPDDISGQTVELKADQGIGDELFVLRFADGLRTRGAKVFYRASEKIYELMKDRPGLVDRVYPRSDKEAQFDHSIRLTVLPHVLNRVDASPLPTGPSRVRRRQRAPARPLPHFAVWRRVYWPLPPRALPMSAKPEIVARYRNILSKLGEPPYIGVTWRAGGVKDVELSKAGMTMLSKNAPVAAVGDVLRKVKGTIVVLQRLPAAGEIARLTEHAGRMVHDFSDANEDLEDMMGLLVALDDYVGVSNTNMHLSVSLGKTARVLVPLPPEWRWMNAGSTTPWFPGFTVYRQRPVTGWQQPLAELGSDLVATYGAREG